MTPFDSAQDAYGLALELDSSVAHLGNAIVCILVGDLESAHRELWRARLTTERPKAGVSS